MYLTHRSIMASTAQSILAQISAPVRELVETTSESVAFGKSDLERKEVTEWFEKIAGGGVSEGSLKVRLKYSVRLKIVLRLVVGSRRDAGI